MSESILAILCHIIKGEGVIRVCTSSLSADLTCWGSVYRIAMKAKMGIMLDKLMQCICFFVEEYSQLSLSRLRLSRITAYLEENIWSLF